MDIDILERVATIQDLVQSVAKSLKDPLNDLSDLANLSRSLRISAETLETYIGIQHARNVREAEDLAGIARVDMRNKTHH